MEATQTAAPAYIARDSYAGKWTTTATPGRLTSDVFTAAELAAFAPEGVVWEYSGHTRTGRELFGRTRYVADSEGNLHCYSSEGAKVIVHPADRKLRVLTRR